MNTQHCLSLLSCIPENNLAAFDGNAQNYEYAMFLNNKRSITHTEETDQKDYVGAENGKTASRADIDREVKRRKEETFENLPPPPGRTIYLGGINGPGAKRHGISISALTVTDICTHIKSMQVCHAPLEAVRVMSEKSCVFIDFTDQNDALLFFKRCYGGSDESKEFYHLRRIININGIELRVGWAKSSIEKSNISLAIKKGATRCVYLHPVEQGCEAALATLFAEYDVVDCVRVVPERNIAFVHMASIPSAMQAVSALSATRQWRKVAFGKDRCCIVNHSSINKNQKILLKPSFQLPYEMYKDKNTQELFENRTVFLGNIPPECTINDLFNTIRSTGPILSVRLLAPKRVAFVTFVEASSAQTFHDFLTNYGITLNGSRLTVGWGKVASDLVINGPVNSSSFNRSSSFGTLSSGVLNPAVTAMLRQGATRSIYIGELEALNAYELAWASKNNAQDVKPYASNDVYKKSLQTYFENYGIIESIDIVHLSNLEKHSSGDLNQSSAISRRRAAFVNFSSIMEAHKAMNDALKDERFKNSRLGYGRDRCISV